MHNWSEAYIGFWKESMYVGPLLLCVHTMICGLGMELCLQTTVSAYTHTSQCHSLLLGTYYLYCLLKAGVEADTPSPIPNLLLSY